MNISYRYKFDWKAGKDLVIFDPVKDDVLLIIPTRGATYRIFITITKLSVGKGIIKIDMINFKSKKKRFHLWKDRTKNVHVRSESGVMAIFSREKYDRRASKNLFYPQFREDTTWSEDLILAIRSRGIERSVLLDEGRLVSHLRSHDISIRYRKDKSKLRIQIRS